MTTIRTVIHDRRIEVPAPDDLPDGTEVTLTIGTDVGEDDGPMTTEEIARVLAAMGRMQPLEIPDEVASRNLEEMEQLRGAVQSYRDVVIKFPDTVEAEAARKRLKELKAKVPGPSECKPVEA